MSDYSDFPWRPGMRVLPDAANKGARMVLGEDYRWVFAVESGIEVSRDNGPCVEAWSDDAITGDEVPDLTDPATVGALAGAVREAYNDPGMSASCRDGRWQVQHMTRRCFAATVTPRATTTDGAAWLAAWQARPKEGA